MASAARRRPVAAAVADAVSACSAAERGYLGHVHHHHHSLSLASGVCRVAAAPPPFVNVRGIQNRSHNRSAILYIRVV